MPFDLAATVVILFGVMVFLVWDRVRYDVVAATALMVAVAVGVVPAKEAFAGFSDDIVILVAAALIVSAAVERSGLADRLLAPTAKYLHSTARQILVLAGAVALLSALMKNVGALAIFLPIAMQISRRYDVSPSRLLMPLAFASLLGGIITMIGTSPNIIVSRLRAEMVGEPFGMFDFTPIGLVLSTIGVAFLTVGWRLLPKKRTAGASQPFSVSDYTAEVILPADSPFVNKTVEAFEDAADGEVAVCAIIRERNHRYTPAGHWWLFANDVLVLQCDATVLKRLVALAKLEVPGASQLAEQTPQKQEMGEIEAVVTEGSPLIGYSARDLQLRNYFGLNMVALSRRGHRVHDRIRHIKLRKGDLVVFQGRPEELPRTVGFLGCLPLARRSIDLGPPVQAWRPMVIVAAAMVLAGLEVVPVATAFFAAAVLMVVTGALKLTDVYERVEWPILVLIACLIPLSEAFQRTGGTGIIAAWLADVAGGVSPTLAVGLVMAVAMAVTPFLNNAATVLVLAPIAAGLATRMGAAPDAFLMAVAIGAACDFLTPIGHQCNTLVMGPGGYRFGDYWRLGLPLSLMVLLVAPPLITMLWPLG